MCSRSIEWAKSPERGKMEQKLNQITKLIKKQDITYIYSYPLLGWIYGNKWKNYEPQNINLAAISPEDFEIFYSLLKQKLGNKWKEIKGDSSEKRFLKRFG